MTIHMYIPCTHMYTPNEAGIVQDLYSRHIVCKMILFSQIMSDLNNQGINYLKSTRYLVKNSESFWDSCKISAFVMINMNTTFLKIVELYRSLCIDFGWWTHITICRWCIIELYTWTLYNFISQCHSSK